MLAWSSCQSVLGEILIPSHWLLSHISIVETMDSGERGMNPVAMTHQSLKGILAKPGNELATACKKYEPEDIENPSSPIFVQQIVWLHFIIINYFLFILSHRGN